MPARILPISTLFLIAACGGAPAVVAPPASEPTGGAAGPSSAWVNDSPFSGQAPPQGAVDYVSLAEGSFVVAQSYGSEAEPFALLTGKKGALSKSKAPWTCAGGPAEIDASGTSLWVHCMGPEEPARVHFWHSADLGKTWTRVGALDGAVALGSYAMAGDKLFVTGRFEGQTARLHVVSRGSDGKFSRSSAKGNLDWPADVQPILAAASDGSQIALLGFDESSELRIAASMDGGATVRPIWKGASKSTSPPSSASIEKGVLTFLAQRDSGPSGVGKIGLADGKLGAASSFPSEAEDACVYGSHVVVKFKKGDWGISSDAGASFASLGAPRAEEMAALECSPGGARYGSQVLAW
ncbi:hypothetical protein [Polyangium sp. 6x1]|uniref:hypothetical protein n=1 Tax=Polyangium sp. 6x1 TaxID=3042689 RepID=UPI0024831883|nr:hypothetical protein [Polyangium sp. 6x1]MDI1443144.1 hypothetical protein [Polyangium sp. 6x1]